MLRIQELKKYAFRRRLRNLEFIRKDYLQDVILFIIYTQIYPHALFKGGTAIWKLLKGERFSQDLDLEIDKKVKFALKIVENLTLWGFSVALLKEKISENAYYTKLRIEAKNFGSTEISIEAIFKQKRGQKIIFNSPYPDIPNFDVYSLSLVELAKEKLGAIIGRDKPRDVFDLYFLLKNYNITLKYSNIDELEKKIEAKRENWSTLKLFLIGSLPTFDYVKSYILSKINSESQ